MLLTTVLHNPEIVKTLSMKFLADLAQEIRDELLMVLADNEGHLASNLGVVELTLALHYVYDFLEDRIVFDVGHQSYVYKLLSKRSIKNIRKMDNYSGFPVLTESVYDHFGTGHAATAISAVLGMALADDFTQSNRSYIALVGDASITSGMAFEALNHLGNTSANVTIILNDNQMSIDPTTGALQNFWADHGSKHFFESLNINYLGAYDGHDLPLLIALFEKAKKQIGPKIIHFKTLKGKGYKQAENSPMTWHAPGKFDLNSGERLLNNKPKYQEIVGKTLADLAQQHPKMRIITPAMASGSGLTPYRSVFKEQLIDVGIAEQHALTLASGMAVAGLKPYVVIYSTFLQRAYDQLIHDIALQNLAVVLLIDRAGLVGEDGATHQGLFDISFINTIPNLSLAAPFDALELQQLLYSALFFDFPIAIRYPKGNCTYVEAKQYQKIALGEVILLKKGTKVAVLSTGTIGQIVQSCTGSFSHYHFPFIKPLNQEKLATLALQYEVIITLEEGVRNGGFGENIRHYLLDNNYTGKINIMALEDKFVTHASQAAQLKKSGLTVENLQKLINNS